MASGDGSGTVPDATLATLLGLAVTGTPEDRIKAARVLTDLLTRNPIARDRAPRPLIDFAELVGPIADCDTIPPGETVKPGDFRIRDAVSGVPSRGDAAARAMR